MSKIRILGISAYYHDSAAAIVEDGEIIAAAQEERFTRQKGDPAFPHNAISFCLDSCGITIEEVDHIVFYENPIVKFQRLLNTYLATAPFGLVSFLKAMPSWLSDKIWLETKITKELGINKEILFCDHHLSHAASAFFPSPFDKAAVITVDGVGEHSTTTYGMGEFNNIQLDKEIRFPNSIGLLYSAFTYFTGFKINSGEYKLMGLAPYGKPIYEDLIIDKLIKINDDGSIILNQKYFNYTKGLTMTNNNFSKLFGSPPRKPESKITQREMDIAASIQSIVNKVLLKIANHVYNEYKVDNLVLAGGVSLNVVATGYLSTNGPFKEIWTQPAAGDAGGALGAALWVWYEVLKNKRIAVQPDFMKGAFLGTEIKSESKDDDEILKRLGASWKVLDDNELSNKISEKIAESKVIAVARGKMEFGPRALGARSILGDARSEKMQTHMNLKIKFRESFRPFAPMVLAEDASKYFEVKQESPYMLLLYHVRPELRTKVEDSNKFGIDLLKVKRSKIPAITHVDYSARVQTVDKVRNPFIWEVINNFKKITDCSVIVNTSFNVRGEPIVNSAEDAYRCFMATEIDYLVIGNRFFDRQKQKNRPLNDKEREKWLRRFELD